MRNIGIYILLLVCFFLSSCKKDSVTLSDEISFRTIIVYIAANNNLSSEAYVNIEQLETNIEDVDGNLLVYANLPNTTPVLYHISNKKGNRKTIKVKEYEYHNSADPMVMKRVITDAMERFPSQSYGLILWSHATGWIPPTAGNIKLKSFGDDQGDEMDIKELKNALPNNLDFILFDACSMASVEVLYEIKDKAKHFIVSPGEVVSNGMPYNKIVNDLFTPDISAYTTIAKKYYEHYNSLSGNFQSATVSVIQASKLQNLADKTKEILLSQKPQHADFKRSEIQRMDFDPSNPLIAFDFLDFIEVNYNNSAQLNYLKEILNQTILYKANTPKFNGITIYKNSGLTCYIPHADNEQNVHEYYRTLSWYQASGFNILF